MKKLVKTFKQNTMLIFEAALLEKRILFVGGKHTPIQQIAQYVCAAAALVSPPIIGILQRVFPFCTWNNLDFLSV